MERKINDIKGIFQAAGYEKLPELIKEYGQDERGGVRALVEKAKKRLNALEKEIARTEGMKIGRASCRERVWSRV